MSSIPPDDLPKSPTGRIPQWVQDEKAGRKPAVTHWRSHSTPILEVMEGGRSKRRTSNVRSIFKVALALTLVCSFAYVYYHRDQEPWAGFLRNTPLASSSQQTPVVSAGDLIAPAYAGGTRGAPGELPEHAGMDAVSGTLISPIAPARGVTVGFPPSGFEEAPQPLGAPAPLASTSSAFAYQYTFKDSGDPVTWSPCRPIHLTINASGAPAGFTQKVLKTAGEISYLTGLRFSYDGLTTEVPSNRRSDYQPGRYGSRWAPVLIGLSTRSRAHVARNVVGLTSVVRASTSTEPDAHYVSGQIMILHSAFSKTLSDGTSMLTQVLRHEFGHLVGLAHTRGLQQVMDSPNTGVANFQAGDLTGLSALGQGTCTTGL